MTTQISNHETFRKAMRTGLIDVAVERLGENNTYEYEFSRSLNRLISIENRPITNSLEINR